MDQYGLTFLAHPVHKLTMTLFIITLYGQCCRRHVVGQRIVCNISVVRSCWSICSLCSKFYNTNLYACSLLYLKRLPYSALHTKHVLTYKTAAGGLYLVNGDHRSLSDVTELYLCCIMLIKLTYQLRKNKQQKSRFTAFIRCTGEGKWAETK